MNFQAKIAGLVLGLGLWLLAGTGAWGQQTVKPCIPITSTASGIAVTSCQDVNSSNPLPVTGTVSPAATTHVQSGVLAANLVVSNVAAKLSSFEIAADSTLSGAAWWLLVFDAASAPGDGPVTPAKCFAMPSGTTNVSGGFSSLPSFGTGIVFSVSTTGCFTKTASAHAFLAGDWQ